MFTISNIIASHILLITLSFCEWCGCSSLAKAADSSGLTLCTDRRRVFTLTVCYCFSRYEHDTQYALPGNVICVTCFPLFLGRSLSSSLNSIFSWLNNFFSLSCTDWLVRAGVINLFQTWFPLTLCLSVLPPLSIHLAPCLWSWWDLNSSLKLL